MSYEPTAGGRPGLAQEPAAHQPAMARSVPSSWLVAKVAAYLAVTQLVLWRFLDVMPPWAYAAALPLIGVTCWAIVRSSSNRATAVALSTSGPTWGVLIVCLAIAFGVLVLGGEGRLFYANVDWQVRDAVLRDLAVNPWPFAYTARGAPDILRAPLGMFLIPALAFKGWGPAAGDWALLIQNTALLGIVLALGSTLFVTRRARIIAVVVFLAFSGLDVIGQIGTYNEHMEHWAGVQFSSTITLAFWVPQHALAGWIAAVLFLLWREGKLALLPLLAVLPLTALWSPLALMGSVVFAAFAGLATLRNGRLVPSDVIVPALSCAVAIPALIYLSAAGDKVGFSLLPIDPVTYVLFQGLETLPFLVPLFCAAARGRTDIATLALVTGSLLAAPLFRIGWSIDFTMRASIPALAVLSMLVTQFLVRSPTQEDRLTRSWLVVVLCLGAAVGTSEIARALMHPPSPRGACSVFGAMDPDRLSGPKDTYVAALDAMPALVRPTQPTLVDATEPARCWARDWYRPSGV